MKMRLHCREVREQLPAYQAGALPPPLAEALDRHLASCPHCRAEQQRLEALEGRLAQELQDWAAVGEPRLDLEALLGTPVPLAASPSPVSFPTGPGSRRPRRRNPWWMAAGLAAAGLFLTLWLSFPRWATAAAEWPVVGPWVKEAVLRQAGFGWAYEHGLLQHPVAEVHTDHFRVRVMGVLADPTTTTVAIEVVRLHQPAALETPRLGSEAIVRPRVGIAAVDGERQTAWGTWLEDTPVGYIGLRSTTPLEQEEAILTLEVLEGEKRWEVSFPVTRQPLSRLAEVTEVNREVNMAGVRRRIHRVVRMPYQTMVEYTHYAERFAGGMSSAPGDSEYLETADGRRVDRAGGTSVGLGQPGGGMHHREIYAPAEGPLTLVVPAVFQVEPIEVAWELPLGDPQGVTRPLAGVVPGKAVPITVMRWGRAGEQATFEFEFPETGLLYEVTGWAVEAADGTLYPLKYEGGGSTGRFPELGPRKAWRVWNVTLPEEVEPVRLVARQAVVRVPGPWRIPLVPAD